MAKITKRGNQYTTCVYLGVDESGKRIIKRLTASTKEELYRKMADFSVPVNYASLTIKDCIERYIASSFSSLSPSTIREYQRMARRRYQSVENIKLSSFTNIHARALVNDWSIQKLSPKSIRNAYNLLTASVRAYRPNIDLSQVSMPKKAQKKAYIPTEEDIKKLLEFAKGKNVELPIMLAAFGSLREGEVAALKKEDYIGNNTIHVQRSMVKAPNGEWQIKEPKTAAGDRLVMLPDYVIEKILASDTEYVCNMKPGSIYGAFARVRNRAGLPLFKFHALRHYFASTLHYKGVPDKYIMEMGGWDDASTLTKIYQHTLEDKREELREKTMSIFQDYIA